MFSIYLSEAHEVKQAPSLHIMNNHENILNLIRMRKICSSDPEIFQCWKYGFVISFQNLIKAGSRDSEINSHNHTNNDWLCQISIFGILLKYGCNFSILGQFAV